MNGNRPELRIVRGDLYWVQPDDSRGPAPAYSHPHVVVQDDVFNHSRITTVVVCALTTNLHRAKEPGNVLLNDGEGGLPKRSVVVVSQISSVEKLRLGEKIGALSQERVEQVLAGLRFQQVSFFPPIATVRVLALLSAYAGGALRWCSSSRSTLLVSLVSMGLARGHTMCLASQLRGVNRPSTVTTVRSLSEDSVLQRLAADAKGPAAPSST